MEGALPVKAETQNGSLELEQAEFSGISDSLGGSKSGDLPFRGIRSWILPSTALTLGKSINLSDFYMQNRSTYFSFH